MGTFMPHCLTILQGLETLVKLIILKTFFRMDLQDCLTPQIHYHWKKVILQI